MTRSPPPPHDATQPPFRVGYVLVPDFPLIAFAAAVEPLRIANRLSGRPLYAWTLISADGLPVSASSGLSVAVDCGIRDAPRCDLVLVCAGLQAEHYDDPRLYAWLRRLHRAGGRIGAISAATYLLAHAGLLHGRRCTVHWESVAAMAERFPAITLSSDIFVVDGPFITCSGGTGTLDMMLHVVTERHGAALAAAISEQVIHPRIRDHHEGQRMTPEMRHGVSHPKLVAMIQAMEQSIEHPTQLAALAGRIHLSTRQMERLSRSLLGQSPSAFYLKLRVERGRALLQQTSLSVLEVALACGFVSATHFSRCFRRCYGRSPREDRLDHGLNRTGYRDHRVADHVQHGGDPTGKI